MPVATCYAVLSPSTSTKQWERIEAEMPAVSWLKCLMPGLAYLSDMDDTCMFTGQMTKLPMRWQATQHT